MCLRSIYNYILASAIGCVVNGSKNSSPLEGSHRPHLGSATLPRQPARVRRRRAFVSGGPDWWITINLLFIWFSGNLFIFFYFIPHKRFECLSLIKCKTLVAVPVVVTLQTKLQPLYLYKLLPFNNPIHHHQDTTSRRCPVKALLRGIQIKIV